MSGPGQGVTHQAREYGKSQARKLLAGRTGHGGGRCTYRQLDEAQIAALMAIAFDAGAQSVLDDL